jgi:molybdenum cofactor cytidylyltransferase
MIPAERVALILLAAGRSERFGDRDKLAEPFLGHPLAQHVVTALEGVPFAARIAVCAGTGIDLARRGYEVVVNDAPAEGQSRSVRLGMAAAIAHDIDAVLIALADMPRVTAAQIWRLLDAARGEDDALASSDGVQPRPPALFGRTHFPVLERLVGDQGARELILKGRHIVTSAAELVDIDTPEDLERLRESVGVADHSVG